jgi:hypothetical protein
MATPSKNSIDDFLMDGGVYPKQSANPADTAVIKPVAVTCAVCGYSWSPVIASDDHVARCPQCDFITPTGQ